MNRKAITTSLVAIMLVLAGVSQVSATEFGGRAFGMGGAYTAISDDVSAVMYNPAGLPRSSFELSLGLGSNNVTAISEFLSLLSNPPDGVSGDTSINVATLSGISVGGFGAGIAADGNLTASSDCGAGVEHCGYGEFLSQFVFGYGRTTVGLPFNIAGLQAGFNIKRLHGRRIEFEKIDLGGNYRIDTTEWVGDGYSAGIGLLLKASDVISVGLAASDVLSSVVWRGEGTSTTYDDNDNQIGTPVTTNLGTDPERLTATYRFGVSVTPPLLGLTLSADAGNDGSVRYGVEKSLLLDTLRLRIGGIRAGGTATTTAGLGLKLGPVRIDAAAGTSDGFKSTSLMLEGSVRF